MILKVNIPDEVFKDYVETYAKVHGYKEELSTENETVIKNPESKTDFTKKGIANELLTLYQRDKMVAARQEVKEKASVEGIEFKVD